ncbi:MULTISPECIES: erythromycin esterase family protein [unclassified Pseudofrankia]|uniref:erythromycin esterase family protein n=1 Tax=unclassified Pseudofrankia TaxID=2994372 RepID=UPI0008DA04C1|nr:MULTISPECIES: erythromycin esterase family protein [unclassified Pseudofrankia]MDT3439981.1 erythromycin esterase family protein [Pseudofrankia sp. BMG5.37]OHV48439.1 erythromycin esterase [Pseudofrankia sp. BMG5.36]
MSNRLFRDRRDAGRYLAGLLAQYRGRPDVLVLGLPRGGVPVAYEVANDLGAPLDVFVVRKLGVPDHEEVAMGAMASGGVLVLNDDVVRGLNLSPEVIQRAAEEEGREVLRREQAYREGRPMPDVAAKTVILVDDGLATGASMRAAVQALRQHQPARIVVAVPAAPSSTCRELEALADEVVCATTPSPFFAVGQSYWDFTQTTDEAVRGLLRAAATSRLPEGAGVYRTEAAVVRSEIVPVQDGVPADDVLFDLVGDADVVLIGEASHGTYEFYAARAAMTRRLIEEKGFCAVAAEADWPDAYRVNRFVRGHSEDVTAAEALRGFELFPTWMWRNTVVLDFVGWLRERNDRFGAEERAKAGFYGLDLYSLYRSIQEVVAYLDRVDPAAARRARERYACLDHYGGDGQVYGYAAAFGAGDTCERQLVDQLVDLQRHAADYTVHDGPLAADDFFYAQQNARTVRSAADYYRSMFTGRVSSWNLRDWHMADTLDALRAHLGRQRTTPAKIVVWAHNSHVGDATATEVATRGELTLGQIARARHPGDCRLVGFTTYTGTVTAASDWDAPADRKRVRPALPDSLEELFHEVGEKEFLVPLGSAEWAAKVLTSARLERAIGVIYRPDTERSSHYFRARAADQFDAIIHIDETRAVEPLERTARWDSGEPSETYPFAA